MIRIFALLVCMAGLTGCITERWVWHQKLTLEVETPSGSVSDSSVVAISRYDVDVLGNYHSTYRGEATVVDLGEGRYLFALLGEGTRSLALRTFNGNPGISREIFAAMEKVRGTRTVLPADYPMLVTFDDISKPETVKRVDPDDLAATFGPGYALKSVTLEITDEPVTTGKVEEVLEWLGPYPEPALGPKSSNEPIPFYRQVHHGDFIRR